MILAIIFAQLWGVIQLIVLTSLSRTVRVRTVLAAMAVGFYAIGPFAAFIQLSWIHLAAPLFGMPADALQRIASYSVDPFIEEAMKLLPLAILMLIPAIRRQWSLSDCVLIGAATGSGFGLTEHIFRYATGPHAAEGISGGWVIVIGNYNVLVPGFFRTMTSWIANGAYFSFDPLFINWHLAWSAMGGLAIGLIVRRRNKAALLTAIGLLLFIGLDHASGNTRHIDETWLALLAAPLAFLTSCLSLLVIATIVAAWWLDQREQLPRLTLGPLLSAEESATSTRAGTLAAAFSRLPWSLVWVAGFDRARRAYQAARTASPDGNDNLRTVVVALRDDVEVKLKQPGSPQLLPSWLTSGNLLGEMKSALRRPPVIIWLILIAPSVLYLIVGGWPQTAGIQRVLAGRFVWPLVLLITIANQSRVVWRVLVGLRRLPATARLPIGDDAAILGLQLACGVGAVSLGAFTLLRVVSGIVPGQPLLAHTHAADAANGVTPESGSAVAGSGGAFDPPPRSPDLPESAADAAAAAAAAGSGAGDGAANDGSPGDSSPSDGSTSDSGGGHRESDASSSEQEAQRAADEATAAKEGKSSSDAAAAQAAADAAESAAREEAAGEASTGGAFDPPPPSPDLPPTAADDAAEASRPATEGKEAGEYEAERAQRAQEDAAQRKADDAEERAGEAQDAGDEAGEREAAKAQKAADDAEERAGAAQDAGDEAGEKAADDATAEKGGRDTSDHEQEAADKAAKDAGDRAADDATRKPKSAPPLTPQEQADRAADAATQADADAAAARQAQTDAMRKADAADIKAATKDPGTDPDVAAAQERTRAAQRAAERADAAALDGDDPWDPNQPNKSAADAFEREAKEAARAQSEAEKAFADKQAADPEAAAAKAAAERAQNALDAANAKAAAAHESAANAQANADAAAAKSASDAYRSANPAQAAADDAQKALTDAQQAENDAFFKKDGKAYHDARAALDAARQKAADAQAAADAARNGQSSDHSRVKKP